LPLLLIPLLAGCQPQQSATPPAALGPEEQFDLVMERFRSRCTATDTILNMADEGSPQRHMRVKSDFDSVTSHIHPPTAPGGLYTAEITVQMSTYLSVHVPPKPADENQPESLVTEESSDDDQSQGQNAKGKRVQDAQLNTPTVTDDVPRRDQVTATYDLTFENGRWVLKTPNVDPSIKLMFDYALAVQ
jgi:hypothetical protein